MKIHSSQTGVGHIAALLVVVVLAVTGFAGYTVWKAGQDKTDSSVSTSQTEPTAIKTKADLDTTSKLLDNTVSQLDSELDTSALDSDIDQLL